MPHVLTLNSRRIRVEADPDKPLLWVLREELKLTGTKFGCGGGLCGACTVIIDGKAARACQTAIADVAGRKVITIEGAAALPAGRKVVKAWTDIDVPQCGYCQAGQVMAATALLMDNARPGDDDIDAAMSGNICRCATYLRIRRAIRMAAGLPDVSGDAA